MIAMRNRNKTLIVYGLALAALAWLLQFVQYKYQLKMLKPEWYVLIIALFFTVLGIWAGRRLTGDRQKNDFERNEKARVYLGISNRELEVLELLAGGYSNREIADQIFVSPNTVKTHLSHIYGKLEVKRRTQAIHKAKKLRLIP